MSIKKYLTRKEAAEYIGMKPNTLATWACKGRYKLPYYKVASKVRYLESDLIEFLKSNQRTQTA